MKNRPVTLSIAVFLIMMIVSGLYMVNRTKNQVKELFQRNKELQEQGYYMAEFEFKMLGIAYDLDKGHYYTSLKLINRLHHQLKTKEGLVKVPEFKNKAEELQFYLNLQNPHTGAFMDDSYPYCTYTGPTGNVLLHLDSLAEQTGQTLKLKYPLKYLDKINTSETMKDYLDDVSIVGWIGAKFPQTAFHFARDMLSLFYEDNTVIKCGLYNVSPQTKQALLQWFYENQDPETGLWGPKSENGKLLKEDTSNTVSIMKVFVDDEGKNVYASFPLRHKDQIAQSIMKELAKPVPQDDALDEWHEWTLKTSKSIKALTRYLWNDISNVNREKAKKFIEYYIRIRFQKCYIPEEGAFSYYPHGKHATLDGTAEFFMFKEIGALSGPKQARLWGTAEQNITDLGVHKTANIEKCNFNLIASSNSVNSLRLYKAKPNYEDLTSGVAGIIYPRKTPVLDIVELTPRVKHWVNSTDQVMGNWVSKEELIRELDAINIEKVPVYKNDIPITICNNILQSNGEIVVIGFDVLQIPRYKVVYEYNAGIN